MNIVGHARLVRPGLRLHRGTALRTNRLYLFLGYLSIVGEEFHELANAYRETSEGSKSYSPQKGGVVTQIVT